MEQREQREQRDTKRHRSKTQRKQRGQDKRSVKSRNNKKKEDFIGLGSITGSLGSVGGDIMGPVKDAANALKDIGNSIKEGLNVFIKIWDLIRLVFDFFKWIVTDLLNPLVWIDDVIMAVIDGLKLFVLALLDAIFTLLYKIIELFISPLSRGILGDSQDVKCYVSGDTCGVPYTVLFATIVMPPLGVFMELGLKGWINIFICACLTLVFYLPGLLYALILLYC